MLENQSGSPIFMPTLNVVIAGAGETGRYIAKLLSKEKNNVTLLDPNLKKLEEASMQMDIATKEGSGTDWQLLDQLLETKPNLIVALTEDDETNLVTAAIAKNLGYPRTIARLRDLNYFHRTRLDFARIFQVDEFIGPEVLVAHEIYKTMIQPGSLRVETFAHGAITVRSLLIPRNWKRPETPLSKMKLPEGLVIGLIRRLGGQNLREEKIIFPHGQDCILPRDEVTVIGESESTEKCHEFFGIPPHTIKSVFIIGGSRTAVNLAKILDEKNYCSYRRKRVPEMLYLV